jgi:hypothetical protein
MKDPLVFCTDWERTGIEARALPQAVLTALYGLGNFTIQVDSLPHLPNTQVDSESFFHRK